MKEIVINRFETKPEFTSDLIDFDQTKSELHIRPDVKNKKLLSKLNIEKLYLIGAKEKDIDFIFSILQPKYVSLYQFLAKDLSCLEQLKTCKTLITEWNTKAPTLWDFKENTNLRELAIRDYGKISDLSQLSEAKQITSLSLDGGIDKKLKLESLEPLGKLDQLKFLRLTNLKISDDSLKSLEKLENLEILELSNQFSTSEYAYLATKLPKTKCKMFNAVNSVNIKDEHGKIKFDTMVTGRRRPFLLTGKDDKKIEKYKNEFKKLKEKYS